MPVQMQLGPLAKRASEKDFPECWTILADMMDLEYELYYLDDNDNLGISKIVIFVDDEEIELTKENTLSTSASVEKELLTKVILDIVKTQRSNKT